MEQGEEKKRGEERRGKEGNGGKGKRGERSGESDAKQIDKQ